MRISLTHTLDSGSVLMGCPTDLCLSQYLDGKLRIDESQVFETHMEDCTECERRIQEMLSQQTFLVWGTEFLQLPESESEAARSIPRYSCIELINQGSFGIVWKMLDHQFNRLVAVKVMRSACARNESLVRRFFSEAQICSQLTHPFIVPIHSMGELTDGRGYIAMKWVDGKCLDELYPQTQDDWLPRLQTFANICQAMAYAHEKGTIHRDLKPQNIMVGRHGEVQVMDWGMAKILGDKSSNTESAIADELFVTRSTDFESTTHGLMGSYPYAAPEQLKNAATADQRADVFSLGSILCELLTGQPAYIGSDRESVVRRASNANLSDAKRRLEFCGADDRVIQLALNCLAPDPNDRPESGSAVADEIQSYLDAFGKELENERIENSRRQILLNESTKKRRLWAALTAILLVATIGLSFLSVFAYRSYKLEQAAKQQQEIAFTKEVAARKREQVALVLEKEARAKAEQNAQNQTYTVKAFVRAFKSTNPEENYGVTHKTTALEVLQVALGRLLDQSKHSNFSPDGRTRASMLNAVGEGLVGIGEVDIAVEAFREAHEICRAELDSKDLVYLLTVNNLGYTLKQMGLYEEAIPLAEEAVRIGESINPRRPETLAALDNLGQVHLENGSVAIANEILKEAYEKRKRLIGPNHSWTLISLNSYAMGLLKDGRYEESIDLLKQLVDVMTETDSPKLIQATANYAEALSQSGNAEQALPILETQLIAARDKFGPSHRVTISVSCNLASAYRRLTQPRKSLELLEPTLEKCEEQNGAHHPLTLSCLLQIGKSYSAQKDFEQAIKVLKESYQIHQTKYGLDHPLSLSIMGNLAIVMFDSEDYENAFPLLEKWVDSSRKNRGPDHKFTLEAIETLAKCYRERGRLDDAESLLAEMDE